METQQVPVLCAPEQDALYENAAAQCQALRLSTCQMEQSVADAQAAEMQLRARVLVEGAQLETTLAALLDAMRLTQTHRHAVTLLQTALSTQEAILASHKYKAYMQQKVQFAALRAELDAIRPVMPVPMLKPEALSGWKYHRPATVLRTGHYYLCNGFYMKPLEKRAMQIEPHHVVCFLKLAGGALEAVTSEEERNHTTQNCIAYIRVPSEAQAPTTTTTTSALTLGVGACFLCELPETY